MKKKSLLLVCLLGLSLGGCGLVGYPLINGDPTGYEEKEVKIYREANKSDKTIALRFYDEAPNVPYIGVSSYFKEFFKTEMSMSRGGDIFAYAHPAGGVMAFDVANDVIFISYAEAFHSHPDLDSSSSKTFLSLKSAYTTKQSLEAIDLWNYDIDVHYDSFDAYLPLTFLSSFAGGISLIQVAYNGEDVYVCDFYGSLTGERRDQKYYKDTYFSVLGDYSKERPEDLINYSYNQLCLMFDHDRGYTSQLLFGDLTLNSIGLDGILELYYPSIKEGLLSKDKETYQKAYIELFMGLDDRGHTSCLLRTPMNNPYVDGNDDAFYVNTVLADKEDSHLSSLASEYIERQNTGWVDEPYLNSLKAAFGENVKNGEFYYHFDDESSTAYVGFDSFYTSYRKWDDFYNHKTDQIPLDTYSFVRSSLYRALEDQATNFVLDITCNGGGDTGAMAGVVGLFNEGKCTQSQTSTLNDYRIQFDYVVDINLDGVCDDLDVAEAKRFESLNVGVLTSSNCFSCGNTFPAEMQQLGYKTMGAKTSGGSCAIAYEFTADGLPYIRSSHIMIGAKDDGTNLDDGVTPDLDIASTKARELGVASLSLEEAAPYFYDVELISNYLESAYPEEE